MTVPDIHCADHTLRLLFTNPDAGPMPASDETDSPNTATTEPLLMTNDHLIEPGLWQEIRINLPQIEASPALFLDRDGILNKDTGYVGDVEQLETWTFAAPLIRAVNLRGWPVIMVTNQSGIARRYFDWQAFAKVNSAIHETLGRQHAKINAVFACGYYDLDDAIYGKKQHEWRKPRPGMLHAAGNFFKIDYPHSMIIGDTMKDIEAGRAAGLENGLLIPSSNTSVSKDDMKTLSLMKNLQIMQMRQIEWSKVIANFGG